MTPHHFSLRKTNFFPNISRRIFGVSKNVYTKSGGGFTLIEIMVSVALFAIVVTVSMGALLTVVDTNRKAQTLQLVMNNLNFAIESMVREMREAVDFDVKTGTGSKVTITKRNAGVESSVSFALNNNALVRTENGVPEALTAEGIFIKQITFKTVGATPKRLLIVVSGYSTTTKSNTKSEFSIQTTVAQRNK